MLRNMTMSCPMTSSLQAADDLLKLHAYTLVEQSLSHELLSSPKGLYQQYYLLLARLHMAKVITFYGFVNSLDFYPVSSLNTVAYPPPSPQYRRSRDW